MKAASVANAPDLRRESIRALAAAGYALIPLSGKVASKKEWQEIPPGAYDERNLPGNYGIALKAGDFVVDVDPRHFRKGDRPLKRLVEAVMGVGGAFPGTFAVKTGGGGLHIYFRKPADTRVRNALKEFEGLEFKGENRYLVGPGSVHPDTGKIYEIAAGDPAHVADAPATLLDLVRHSAVSWETECPGVKDYVQDAQTQARFASYLQDAAEPSVEGKRGDENAYRVACRGRDFGLPPALTYDLMLDLWNPRCSPPWDDEELKAKVINAYQYARGSLGSQSPEASFTPLPVPPVSATAPKEEAPEIAWDLTPQNTVKRSFQNLLNYLRHPQMGMSKVFGYNEFTGDVEFTVPAPWHRGMMPRFAAVCDADLKMLKAYLVQRHGFEMNITQIEEAVSVVARDNRYHPVREYLTGLVWDKKPRLDFWLQDYLGVVDSEYVRAVGRKTLCGAVMRVMRPGVKFDHVLLLEGVQDLGKSTVVDILAHPWSADFPVDPHNRDTIQLMQGKWIIELAELEVTRRTETDALKAFLSRRSDKARLAYGRLAVEMPRQSIFIATKNPGNGDGFLKDDTGNRRWWPVMCYGITRCGDQVDFRGLKAERNQLFAEAVWRVQEKGEHLFMETKKLKDAARDEVSTRQIVHPWTDRIGDWLLMADPQKEFVTARDVFCEALQGLDKQFDRRAQLGIAACMRHLGWGPITHRVGEHGATRVVRGYIRNRQQTAAEKAGGTSDDVLGDLL